MKNESAVPTPPMTYAIKAEVTDPSKKSFAFTAQKTMYAGKRIAAGDTIFVFASENEGGPGLVAVGIVTSATPTPLKPGVARQTPRVSIAVRRTALAKRRLGRAELKPFSNWTDGRQKPDSRLRRQAARRDGEQISVEEDRRIPGGYVERLTRRKGAARSPRCDPIDGVSSAMTELNFKFHRQATNKIVGLTDATAKFLHGFF